MLITDIRNVSQRVNIHDHNVQNKANYLSIGGGGFMLVRNGKGEYEFIDFREKAPAAAYQDMYVNNTDASLYGGLAR